MPSEEEPKSLYEEGMQVGETRFTGHLAHTRLLGEVSAIDQAEGPSDMIIEDNDMIDMPLLVHNTSTSAKTAQLVSKLAEAENAPSAHAGSSRAKSKDPPLPKWRGSSAPANAVERGRRFKRTVDDAELDVPGRQENVPNNKGRGQNIRRRRAARIDSPHSMKSPLSASPPNSPKRLRVNRRPGRGRSSEPLGTSRSAAPAHDDLGLADAIQKTLDLRDPQAVEATAGQAAEERHGVGTSDEVKFAVSSDGAYSSPPPGGETVIAGSSSGSSVKPQHRTAKKPVKRKDSKGIAIPQGGAARKRSAGLIAKRARAAAAKAKGLPTTIAKEAPVLGDSDSSDDPMAI